MGTYLGQNFLIDAKVRGYIADKILALYHECGCESLIEIGPGKGSITKLIQNISPNFFVIEKDPTFYENGKLRIENGEFILGDVLEVDVEKLLKEKKLHSDKTLVVGNLPYYITSPILRKFFGYGKQEFAGGIFMVQDEVAQRLQTDAKKKSYLWRLLNYAYDIKYLKGVPAKCFKPAPKVKSALIEFRIKNLECRINRDRFIGFLELFAPFSRKTLGAIDKMLDKRFAINAPVGCDKNGGTPYQVRGRNIEENGGSLGMSFNKFIIPETLQKKRLEELDWADIETIFG